MALAHEYNYLNVQIGTVDFTSYLANTEQVASVPYGSEIGRATLTFRDDGTLPAIQEWGTVVIKAGTAAPGTPVWGGFATRQSSEPVSIHGGDSRIVTVDCQSYAIRLATTEPINDTYGGGNNESIVQDYVIVDDLVSTYLPAFYDAGSISSASPVQCNYIQFSQETLRSALNKVVERSAKEFGITAGADFFYRPTGSLGVLDQILVEEPDYDETFPMQAKPYFDDDAVELRNAVRVLGGWTVSAIQTESFLTDGIVYAFQVAYFPQQIISVALAGVPQTVGVYLVDDPADFDCLVHYDQRKFYYQLPPSAGKTLEIVYRYPVRVVEDIFNAASIAAVGGTLWGPAIVDSSISDGTVAGQIGSAYLASATASIERGQITTSWVGTAALYQPGQIIKVSATALGWESNQLEIQAVTMRFAPRPGGVGSCLTYWDMNVGSPLSIGRTMGESFGDAPETTNWKEAPLIQRGLIAADVPTLDHGTGLSGLADDDHTIYLLASGARAGASSQDQLFGNAVTVSTDQPVTPLNLYKYHGTASTGAGVLCLRGRGTAASPADVADADLVGTYSFQGYYGGAGRAAARLQVLVDGAPSGTAVPGRLVFATASSAGTMTEVMRLTSAQRVGIGTSAPATLLHVSLENATTNAIDDVLSIAHNSSGTPAAGFGSGLLLTLHSSTTKDQDAAKIETAWIDATHATRTAKLTLKTVYQGAAAQGMILGESGAIFNEDGNSWADFRIEGDTATRLFFVDASSDRVGIGTDAPETRFHVSQTSGDTNASRAIVMITHNSTGTPAAGFGAHLLFNLESDTTTDLNAAMLDATWSSATHASRKGQLSLRAYDATTFRTGLTIGTNGSAALVGLYGTTPVAQATTGLTGATFVENSGNPVSDKSTFDGYDLTQIVQALRNIGILA